MPMQPARHRIASHPQQPTTIIKDAPMPASNRRKAKTISHGRPPLSRKNPTTLSSKTTRTLIRNHHQLEKSHALALRNGDTPTAQKLEAEIEQNGGLNLYQQASITGQSATRGGDSSKILVQWLDELLLPLASHDPPSTQEEEASSQPSSSPPPPPALTTNPANLTSSPALPPPLRLLEIGSLNPHNHCARTPLFGHGAAVTRIDLRAQHPLIQQQDFMQRPLPADPRGADGDGFDVVSLSLVLNYVADARRRGEMLRRTRAFLRGGGRGKGKDGDGDDGGGGLGWVERGERREKVLPCLFLVLPAPCVMNSRYLTEERLREMMEALGFALVKRKVSAKLVYYLWRFGGERGEGTEKKRFAKKEVNPGRTRNNFCVVLD